MHAHTRHPNPLVTGAGRRRNNAPRQESAWRYWMLLALTLALLLACADDGDGSGDDAGANTSADDSASDDADDSTADDELGDDATDDSDDDAPLTGDGGPANGELRDAATDDTTDADTGPDDTGPDDTGPDDTGPDDSMADDNDDPSLPDDGSDDTAPEPNDASVDPIDAASDAGPLDVEAGPPPGSAFPDFDGGISRQFVEVENNDSLVVANDMGYGSGTVMGELYPNGDYDLFQFEVRHPTNLSVTVEDTSSDPDVIGCNEQQIIMDVINASGTTVVSASQINDCPWFDWQLNENARGVPPGIYYIRISMYSSQPPTIDEYRVTLELESECGNGVVEGEETCEGDDACIECQRVPTCGDGYVDLPAEGCEDTGPDDGCTEQCLREFATELEPNDVIAEASERAEQDARIISADTLLGGTLIPPDNTDVFQIDASADSIVYVSIYNTETGAECARTLDDGEVSPTIAADVFDATGGLIRGASRTLGSCAAFAVNLTGGQSHFLEVSGFAGNRVDLYRTEVDFVALLGEENEGQNDTPAGALVVAPVAPMDSVAVHGEISETDQDWYSVELPGRQALRVETLPRDPALGSWCPRYDAELRVEVYDADGVNVESAYITDDNSHCGKLEFDNPLTTPQRYDIAVTPGDSWSGTSLDYNVVFKTRNVAP